MLAQIYTGCKCPGHETWKITIIEDTDTKRDEVIEVAICTVCGATGLTPKMNEKGQPYLHALTPEEIEWERLFSNNSEIYEDYEDFDENFF